MTRRRLITAAVAFFAAASLQASAQTTADTLVTTFRDSYLDSVVINTNLELNNYSMLGVNYGVGYVGMSFNPSHTQKRMLIPGVWSVMFTHYEKMFDYIPYFGFTTGVAYTREGYKFESGTSGYVYTMDGASQVVMREVEVPFLCQIHSDTRFSKFYASAGFYGGYRLDIERTGIAARITDDISHSFLETDRRIEYGLEGGIGFAIVLSPIEVHVQALCRYSWSSLYEPNTVYTKYNRSDYESKEYLNDYYWRFAYPLDFMVTAGIHFQIGKRTGRTTADLKREARRIVYGE